MSVKDLIASWEEALVLALSQPDDEDPVAERHDGALTNEGDRRLKSNVHAGSAADGNVIYTGTVSVE